MDRKIIALGAKCELARRHFYDYCLLKAPDFYKHEYLKTLCDTLQEFIEGEDDVLIVNMPPRAGKSRTMGNLVEWIFGKDPSKKVMTGSYNETLSTAFSKQVRNTIQMVKADPYIPVYSDVFPNVRIKQGDGAMNLWALEGGHQNYLATSPSGTSTGFGCQILQVDDIIKNALEAYNANIKQGHWEWFTSTMLSRLEEGGKIIIVGTRWATDDLTGRALKHFGDLGLKIKHVVMKAKNDDGTMLCDDILSAKSYEIKKATMPKDIFLANYQQEPVDIKGRLYTSLKTYDGELPKFKQIRSYTDTADTGSDYLCSFVYGVTFQNEAYILDAYYTQEAMEITEPATAEMLYRNKVNVARIESNNGGRGFARNIERILKQDYKTNETVIQWFTQTKNKVSRILSNSTWVMEHIYFPAGWENRWPELAESLLTYQRTGKNAHDDACFVAGTMVATLFGDRPIETIKKGDYVITPFGIRKVLNAGKTGEKEVIKNIGLEGTKFHKVFAKNGSFTALYAFTGIAECDILSLGGVLQWKYRKLLCSMVLNTHLQGRKSIILASQIPMQDGRVLKDFMLRCGNFITTNQFQKAVTFIIKMATLTTTTLAIWSVYLPSNIFRCMARKEHHRTASRIGKLKDNCLHLLGTGARKAKSSTKNLGKCLGKITQFITRSARSVVRNSIPILTEPSFVQTSVVRSGEVTTGESNTPQPVLCVAKSSKEQNINLRRKNQRPVQNCVQTDLIGCTERKAVYNLTVDQDHVYYAHGLLVSNCDALTGVCEDVNDIIRLDYDVGGYFTNFSI